VKTGGDGRGIGDVRKWPSSIPPRSLASADRASSSRRPQVIADFRRARRVSGLVDAPGNRAFFATPRITPPLARKSTEVATSVPNRP